MTGNLGSESKPTITYVVDFWLYANEAWEYDSDYMPDWEDGYSTYNNEAVFCLCEMIEMNPIEWARAVLEEWRKRRTQGAVSYIEEIVLGYELNPEWYTNGT